MQQMTDHVQNPSLEQEPAFGPPPPEACADRPEREFAGVAPEGIGKEEGSPEWAASQGNPEGDLYGGEPQRIPGGVPGTDAGADAAAVPGQWPAECWEDAYAPRAQVGPIPADTAAWETRGGFGQGRGEYENGACIQRAEPDSQPYSGAEIDQDGVVVLDERFTCVRGIELRIQHQIVSGHTPCYMVKGSMFSVRVRQKGLFPLHFRLKRALVKVYRSARLVEEGIS